MFMSSGMKPKMGGSCAAVQGNHTGGPGVNNKWATTFKPNEGACEKAQYNKPSTKFNG